MPLYYCEIKKSFVEMVFVKRVRRWLSTNSLAFKHVSKTLVTLIFWPRVYCCLNSYPINALPAEYLCFYNAWMQRLHEWMDYEWIEPNPFWLNGKLTAKCRVNPRQRMRKILCTKALSEHIYTDWDNIVVLVWTQASNTMFSLRWRRLNNAFVATLLQKVISFKNRIFHIWTTRWNYTDLFNVWPL